jgi:hypothetical protein
MKEAGCRGTVGYESGDPQILKNIKKAPVLSESFLPNRPRTAHNYSYR